MPDTATAAQNVCYRVLSPEQVDLGPAAFFVDFWKACRGAAFAPRWSADFRLADLPDDVVPNVSVVDVIDGGARYFYRFWGSNNAVMKGYEMSQRYLEDVPFDSVRANGERQFAEVIRRREPLAFIYVSEYRHSTVGCFTLRVPLSSDGVSVDKIASYQDLAHRRNDWVDLFVPEEGGSPLPFAAS